MKKIAIMQPYFFPYLGYWQLISAVDTFVLYDDVNYIKGGWINRNNILINAAPYMITLPLLKSSSFSLINEIYVTDNKRIKDDFEFIEKNYVLIYEDNQVYEKYQVHFYLFKLRN